MKHKTTKADKEQEEKCVHFLLKRGFTDDHGIIYTPYNKNDPIPSDEWTIMEHLVLNKGYIIKHKP